MPSGGARQGAGRPKVDKPLVTKCFRVDETAFNAAQEKHGKKLSGKVNAFIKKISKKVDK